MEDAFEEGFIAIPNPEGIEDRMGSKMEDMNVYSTGNSEEPFQF